MPTCSQGRAARANVPPRSFAPWLRSAGENISPAARAAHAVACFPARIRTCIRVVPEKGKQIIGVGVMREMLDTVAVKSFEDGAKVILIPQAERMNAAAQNCLLKTLEEPPGRTVFFLITDQPAALLPTIVSRCRVVRFHPLTEEACAEAPDCPRPIAGDGAEKGAHSGRRASAARWKSTTVRLDLRMELTHNVFSVHRSGGRAGRA